MKNNKGAVTVLAIYLWANTALVVGGVALTPSFRERKAIEYCQSEGIANCEQYVASMGKAEVLAYIKDTQERPR